MAFTAEKQKQIDIFLNRIHENVLRRKAGKDAYPIPMEQFQELTFHSSSEIDDYIQTEAQLQYVALQTARGLPLPVGRPAELETAQRAQEAFLERLTERMREDGAIFQQLQTSRRYGPPVQPTGGPTGNGTITSDFEESDEEEDEEEDDEESGIMYP